MSKKIVGKLDPTKKKHRKAIKAMIRSNACIKSQTNCHELAQKLTLALMEHSNMMGERSRKYSAKAWTMIGDILGLDPSIEYSISHIDYTVIQKEVGDE